MPSGLFRDSLSLEGSLIDVLIGAPSAITSGSRLDRTHHPTSFHLKCCEGSGVPKSAPPGMGGEVLTDDQAAGMTTREIATDVVAGILATVAGFWGWKMAHHLHKHSHLEAWKEEQTSLGSSWGGKGKGKGKGAKKARMKGKTGFMEGKTAAIEGKKAKKKGQ